MKRTFIHLLLFLFSTINYPLSTSAQTTAFAYQGFLTDSGAPAQGIYDLRFTIYDSPGGNNVVGGPLDVPDVGVTNGLFAVPLDFGSAPFDGSDRWVQVAVRPGVSTGAYTSVTPRQQIPSAPYAIRALNATSFSGTVSDAQLSTNVARLNSNQVFSGAVSFSNSANSFSGAFSGNGAGVTGVDLRTANSVGAILWTTNSGNFLLVSSPTVGANPYAVTAADVNGDGKVDLISANNGGTTLSVLTNNSSGGFVLSSSPDLGGNQPYSVTAADVNGDGKMDLISQGETDTRLYVLTNNGSGGFVLSSKLVVGSGSQSVAAADVNGDGKVDLISANNGPSTLSVLTNNGSGGFVLSATLSVGTTPYSVAAADVNGDGKVDLISADYSDNTLTVLTNNGSGGFVLASSPAVGPNPTCVTAADINRDGRLDLISANYLTNTLTVLTNAGGGNFGLAATLEVGSRPYWVTAADLNGDGRVDLISANATANTLSVLTDNGSGGFTRSDFAVGRSPISVAVADVSGDGRPDLVSANLGTNNLSVLFQATTITAGFNGSGGGLSGLVKSVNALQNDVTLVAGPNVSFSTNGQNLTISSGVGGGGVVTSLNSLQNAVTLAAGGNVALNTSGNTITISASSGGGGSGWSLTGNAGTSPVTNFLGTIDNQALELRVNGARALRLEPNDGPNTSGAPNLIGGAPVNFVAPGVVGAVIAGGGATSYYGNAPGSNSVLADLGAIGGGYVNTIQTGADVSTIGGGRINTIQSGAYWSAIGGGNDNTIQTNAFDCTIGGGRGNTAAGSFSTVGGGQGNTASGSRATVAGGYQNLSSGDDGTVSGGYQNTNSGGYATISGGAGNISSGYIATVSGGSANTSSGAGATISGGDGNTAAGFGATVPGGAGNYAGGSYSFSAGQRAKANHDGAFVWADFDFHDFASTAVNQFSVRAGGGARFVSGVNFLTGEPNAGVELASGGGSWSSISDRNAKENFSRVNPREILQRLAETPISTWNYKSQDRAIRHIGPMAQDFAAAFQVGEDDKHITTIDADGVALAAIQGLNQIVKERDAQIERLQGQNNRLEERLNALEKRITDLCSNINPKTK